MIATTAGSRLALALLGGVRANPMRSPTTIRIHSATGPRRHVDIKRGVGVGTWHLRTPSNRRHPAADSSPPCSVRIASAATTQARSHHAPYEVSDPRRAMAPGSGVAIARSLLRHDHEEEQHDCTQRRNGERCKGDDVEHSMRARARLHRLLHAHPRGLDPFGWPEHHERRREEAK